MRSLSQSRKSKKESNWKAKEREREEKSNAAPFDCLGNFTPEFTMWVIQEDKKQKQEADLLSVLFGFL